MTPAIDIAGIGPAVSEAVQAKIAAVMRTADGVSISVVPTSGRRSAAVNALIANVQAGRARNPWYIKRASDAWTAIKFVANGLTSVEYATRKASADQIGRFMLEAVTSNVDSQRNASGSAFKALSPNYAAYKRRKFGFVTPILKATGDLTGGLRTRIDGLK